MSRPEDKCQVHCNFAKVCRSKMTFLRLSVSEQLQTDRNSDSLNLKMKLGYMDDLVIVLQRSCLSLTMLPGVVFVVSCSSVKTADLDVHRFALRSSTKRMRPAYLFVTRPVLLTLTFVIDVMPQRVTETSARTATSFLEFASRSVR